MGCCVRKIVSGGQTGVDRAALDVALDWGLPVGGWCPRGRRAEDGTIPERYPLQETESPQYEVRTRRNVRDSDGTLVLTSGDPVGGTALTIVVAEQMRKPVYIADLNLRPSPLPVIDWLGLHRIETLNVAGPRESTLPGIRQRAAEFLTSLLDEMREE